MRGRGVCVHVGRFGEMMGDDDDDVLFSLQFKFHVMNVDISL